MAHYQAAHDAGFRELVDKPAGSDFRPHPILYEVVQKKHEPSRNERKQPWQP